MSSSNRFDAVAKIGDKPTLERIELPPANIDFYAKDVFNETAIRQYLSKGIAEQLIATINNGTPLDPTIAGDVAHAMKEWAIERGATHYTHWFQPLTSGTAEKHDSFLEPDGNSSAIMSFSGKNLVVGESDASSFPSGGIRSTFEARGYTAWDPTSPAFIKRHPNGATLCIPTAFCSYTGAALDKKTPLLRSIQALKASVRRLMNCFGVEEANAKVTLGAEQEYFLIDKKFYLQRPDLIQTGRTLFGAPPAKHQQLEDHYFGSIKPRIVSFMTEVEKELWALGIPAKTRHNEVAPAQFELAPVFEELNLSVDHNMLVMEVLRTVAERYGLICLLHEKPFVGVNGSGKHNNWSVSYGSRNLLDPGKDPEQNMIFLTVLAGIIRGIDLHADLLRACTCSVGNDHRLGAGEAPPAIISIFLGDQLNEIVERIVAGDRKASKKLEPMRIGVDTLPPLPRDATDRNRTSPFAFTSNKFEFRSPGSSQSCANVNMMLNTIVAESLDYISEKLEKVQQKEFTEQLQIILKDIMKKHKRIIFNGNGYSEEWRKEAEKRGLPNLANTLEGLKPLLDNNNQKFLEKYAVLSKIEMSSRYEVFLEDYYRRLRIEGEIASELASSVIMPVVMAEYKFAVEALETATAIKLKAGTKGIRNKATILGVGIDAITECCSMLNAALVEMNAPAIIEEMTKLRKIVDDLECVVDDQKWPLPKYREMLFLY
ncbi:MAG: glutamine synthetase III [Kiritimatiellae bacterium]|nr:glutamine synthetase III [Kiritimatiellia bacterium]